MFGATLHLKNDQSLQVRAPASRALERMYYFMRFPASAAEQTLQFVAPDGALVEVPAGDQEVTPRVLLVQRPHLFTRDRAAEVGPDIVDVPVLQRRLAHPAERLHDRRGDDRRDAGARHRVDEAVDHERDEGGGARAPQERADEQPCGLGLEAIDGLFVADMKDAEAVRNTRAELQDYPADAASSQIELMYRQNYIGQRGAVAMFQEEGYSYTGGAHPNTVTETILWDKAQKKRISIRPFFSETADRGPTMTAMAKLVRIAVATEKRERWKESRSDDEKKEPLPSVEDSVSRDEQLQRAIQPRRLKIGPISLAPSTAAGKSSGLTFHFSPYDVDAYAAGPYTVFVPWTALKPFLSPEGAAIFGGERPKGDDDDGPNAK